MGASSCEGFQDRTAVSTKHVQSLVLQESFHSPTGSAGLPLAALAVALKDPALLARMRKTPHRAFSTDAVALCDCSHAAARSSRKATTCHQHGSHVGLFLTVILVPEMPGRTAQQGSCV